MVRGGGGGGGRRGEMLFLLVMKIGGLNGGGDLVHVSVVYNGTVRDAVRRVKRRYLKICLLFDVTGGVGGPLRPGERSVRYNTCGRGPD